jgi:hypothetical protein
VVSDNSGVAPETCPEPSSQPLIDVVQFNRTQFSDNLCGPPGAGGGASIFYGQKFTLDIICSDATQTQPIGANDTSNAVGSCSAGAQQLCHQCMHIRACPEWQGNEASTEVPWPLAASEPVATAAPSLRSARNVASSPLYLRHRRRGRHMQPRASTGLPERRPGRALLQTGSAAGGGLASGPVSLRALKPDVSSYAAGSRLNMSVEVRSSQELAPSGMTCCLWRMREQLQDCKTPGLDAISFVAVVGDLPIS